MKKTEYWTLGNISCVARNFKDGLIKIGIQECNKYEMKNPALLVLDMQNYFLLPQSHAFLPSAQAIVGNINQLISLFYAKKLPVFFTRHTNNSFNAAMMARRWRHLLPEAGSDSEIFPGINTTGGAIIEKHQYNAFHQTNLQELLTASNITDLIITGVVLNLCVETTAREAFCRGFSTIVPIDTTCSVNEEMHFASLAGISYAIGFTPPSEIIFNVINEMELE